MVNEKSQTVSNTTSHPNSSETLWKTSEPLNVRTFVKAWYLLIFHLLACLVMAFTVVYAVDGYMALDTTTQTSYRFSKGKFRLQPSDITSLISASTAILGVIVASWCASSILQCAFAELENPGLTIAEFNRVTAWPNIPPLNFRGISGISGISGIVVVILLCQFPQAYISPLFEGSVNWGEAFELVAQVPMQSGNPAADYSLWGWYGSQLQDRQAAVRRAAGMANQAWVTTNGSVVSTAAQKTCRHVVNDNGFPVHSVLVNATIPCIVINSVNWPTTPESDLINNVADTSVQVSVSDTTAFSYVNYPGNAVLFDQTNTTLKLPFSNFLENSDFDLLSPPTPPESFMFSGMMTAIVLLGKDYDEPPYLSDGFGYAPPNNNFTTGSSFGQLHFTYLEVNFTVGVTRAQTSNYISSQVVESSKIPKDEDIIAGEWVLEALYLMPDVMSMVSIMNTTSLDTWQNIQNYTENLIRYSYQGAWDMLQRNFDPNTTTLVAQIAEPRVQATVSHIRVWVWLGINLLMTLTIVPLAWLTSKSKRNIVVDGPLALLLTDTTNLFKKDDSKEVDRDPKENHHLSNLAFLSEKEEGVKLKLKQMPNGSHALTAE